MVVGRHFVDGEVIRRLLKITDAAILTCLAIGICAVTALDPDATTPARTGYFSLTMVMLCLLLLREFKLYTPTSLATLKTMFLSIAVVEITGSAFIASSAVFGLPLRVNAIAMWLLASGTYMLISRLGALVLSKPLVEQGRLLRRIAIVGGGKAAEETIALLESSPDLQIEIVGLFDDRFDTRSPESVRRHKKLGSIVDLSAYARANRVDLVIVAIPMTAEQRLLHILKRLWELPVDIRISAASSQLKFAAAAYSHLGKLPLLSVFERPLNSWNQFLKDSLDRCIALVAIIVLSPALVFVAIAVKWESRGPIIFRQKRFGFNNELIEVYKFRSMYVDKSDASATTLVTKDDPRVTKVGRIIRKTSLDELPQLFNVLKGTLSLVGPRPHATQAKAAGGLYDEVVEGYFARHKVKPGITGWAQVNGWRGETDTVEKITERVKHDLEYIDHWSLVFDLRILLKTPLALLKSENAY